MNRILTFLPTVLFACQLNAQSFEDVEKALPFVQFSLTDSTLNQDPVNPDSFILVPPGEFYVLKGEFVETTTYYGDGRPPETNQWYEARYAGKVKPPDYPAPPIAKLPRYQDGWLAWKQITPRGVSFSELAEDLLAWLPIYEAEELDPADFFSLFESFESRIVTDAKKRYVDKNTFKMPFENGTERTVAADSTFGEGANQRKNHYEYLGFFPTQGHYVVEVTASKSKRYDYISRADGRLMASVAEPVTLPVVSPDGRWLATSCKSADYPVYYLKFHQSKNGKLSEDFVIRAPFQKIVGLNWEFNDRLLLRVQTDDPANTGSPIEKYYRIVLKLPE